MAINLSKSGTISLVKENKINKCMVGLGWDQAKASGIKGLFSKLAAIDCDAAALLVFDKKKPELIYYGNKESRTGCVKHMGDNLTGAGEGDDEQIYIDLDKMPDKVKKIVIGVNIFNAVNRKQSFGIIKNCFIRLVDNDTNREVCRYDISGNEEYAEYISMVMGELVRCEDGSFEFTAIGKPNKAGSCNDMFNEYKN